MNLCARMESSSRGRIAAEFFVGTMMLTKGSDIPRHYADFPARRKPDAEGEMQNAGRGTPSRFTFYVYSVGHERQRKTQIAAR